MSATAVPIVVVGRLSGFGVSEAGEENVVGDGDVVGVQVEAVVLETRYLVFGGGEASFSPHRRRTRREWPRP